MSRKPELQLPFIAKIAVVATFFNSWVLFEETIVDRFGLWQYLPYYRFGLFCAWDVAALLLIILGVWFAFRGRWLQQQGLAAESKETHCFLKLRQCVFCR